MISASPKLIPVTLNATDTDIEIQYWSNFHQQCFWRKSSPKHFHNENHAITNFFCHETNLSSLPFCVPPNSDTYTNNIPFIFLNLSVIKTNALIPIEWCKKKVSGESPQYITSMSAYVLKKQHLIQIYHRGFKNFMSTQSVQTELRLSIILIALWNTWQPN